MSKQKRSDLKRFFVLAFCLVDPWTCQSCWIVLVLWDSGHWLNMRSDILLQIQIVQQWFVDVAGIRWNWEVLCVYQLSLYLLYLCLDSNWLYVSRFIWFVHSIGKTAQINRIAKINLTSCLSNKVGHKNFENSPPAHINQNIKPLNMNLNFVMVFLILICRKNM